jgi:hypothetical protein
MLVQRTWTARLVALCVGARLAMSRPDRKSTSRAITLPWNEQVLGSTLTLICAVA